MAYDPRLTAYQIPHQPLFQSTRHEIERSLFSLEEKLRRRKQIDFEMQVQRQSDLARTAALAPPPVPYYDPISNIEERERAHRSVIQQQLIQQKIAEQSRHAARIELLKVQRDQLNRQATFSAPPTNYASPAFQVSSPSDQELLKKYEDGTKAREYYQDLEGQLRREEEDEIRKVKEDFAREQQLRQQLREEIQRQQKEVHQASQYQANQPQQYQANQPQQYQANQPQKYQSERKRQKSRQVGKIKGGPVEETPYNYIRQSNTTKKETSEKKQEKVNIAKQLQKQFDEVRKKREQFFQKSNNKAHTQSVFKMPSTFQETNRNASPVRFLNDTSPKPSQLSPYKQTVNRYKSMGKMPCNRSRSNLSPHKTSIIDNSYLQSKHAVKNDGKISMKEMEGNAIKKIQNRLRLSKIIYEDSRFRTSKYEGNHLFNTYEIEEKTRREIKDKINNHPVVLRKHALVVQ